MGFILPDFKGRGIPIRNEYDNMIAKEDFGSEELRHRLRDSGSDALQIRLHNMEAPRRIAAVMEEQERTALAQEQLDLMKDIERNRAKVYGISLQNTMAKPQPLFSLENFFWIALGAGIVIKLFFL